MEVYYLYWRCGGGWLEGLGGEAVFASRRAWLIIWDYGMVFIMELLV